MLERDTYYIVLPCNFLPTQKIFQTGTLIRRHRIPLPPPNDDQFYTMEHFNIGTEIMLYGRTFKITGCDQFTYNFLRKTGVRVNPPETKTPDDPYTNFRKGVRLPMIIGK